MFDCLSSSYNYILRHILTHLLYKQNLLLILSQTLTNALMELINVHRTVIIQLVLMPVAVMMASSLMLTDELVMVSALCTQYSFSNTLYIFQTSMSAVMVYTAVNKSVITPRDHTIVSALMVSNLIVTVTHVQVRNSAIGCHQFQII